MPHQAAKFGSALLGQQLGGGLLVDGLLELDLDEFMARQGVVQRAHNGLGNARLAHVHQGPTGIGEAAKVAALAPGQRLGSLVFR